MTNMSRRGFVFILASGALPAQAQQNDYIDFLFSPMHGGTQPAPPPSRPRARVRLNTTEPVGTILIDTAARRLYLVEPDGFAQSYPVGIGREGYGWHGTEVISAKKEWPDWRPPADMRARRPDLPAFVRGGPTNPMGARALYLGQTLYRIHGSNEPDSIGTASSSGCFRMLNEDVIDLYDRTKIGSKVRVY